MKTVKKCMPINGCISNKLREQRQGNLMSTCSPRGCKIGHDTTIQTTAMAEIPEIFIH